MRRSIRATRAARWSASTGRLIGINTAIYSQTGGSVGIGFATPSNIVARIVGPATNGGARAAVARHLHAAR
jgi:S1-C subfamily serine protease